MKITLKALLIGLTLTTLYGCGGDSGSTAITDSYVLPAGKTTIVFSAMSSARLPASISGIDFNITLPAGMSLTTANGTSGQIDSTTITPSSSLTGTNLAFGSYSTTSRKAHLVMATTSNSYRSGEFLRLTCTVAPSTSITLGNLKSTNEPVAIVKAVGESSGSTVQLTDKIKIIIGM